MENNFKLIRIIEKIHLDGWRIYNKVDGINQWVGGIVIKTETGKSYPVKTTEQLIKMYSNEKCK